MAPTNDAGVIRPNTQAINTNYHTPSIVQPHGGGMQTAGIPDLLVVIEGRMIALEAKHQRPGATREGTMARVTRLQQFHLDALKEAGAVAEVVVSAEEALAAIEATGLHLTK